MPLDTRLGWSLYLLKRMASLAVTFWNFGLNFHLTWRASRSGITEQPSARCLVWKIPALVILNSLFCLLESNTLAGSLTDSGSSTPILGASRLEFRGESRYEVVDKNGALKPSDTNNFTLVISGRIWNLTLTPGRALSKPTTIIDDGTNFFVFASGAGGTCRMGDKLNRYEDSISMYKSGDRYPLHHGTGAWLLFACNSSLTLPSGDAGSLFRASQRARLKYEREDDARKNSFGPSAVRLFTLPALGAVKGLMIAELTVSESRMVGGFSIPMKVELRKYGQRDRKREPELTAVYHIGNISFASGVPLPLTKPEITQPTLITEHRVASAYEYVASSWLPSGQVQDLIGSRTVRFHVSRTRPGQNSVAGFVVLTLFVVSGLLLLRRPTDRRNKVEEAN